MVWAACKKKVHQQVVNRIREINGDFASRQDEKFHHNVFKECAKSMTEQDMESFVDWFVQTSSRVVGSTDKIKAKLREIRKYRLCYFHVMCDDNPEVPPENSMCKNLRTMFVTLVSVHRNA